MLQKYRGGITKYYLPMDWFRQFDRRLWTWKMNRTLPVEVKEQIQCSKEGMYEWPEGIKVKRMLGK